MSFLSLRERMENYADIGGPDECWEWLAQIDSKGYGKVWDGSSTRTAHRMSWSLTHDTAVPEGMEVLHSCRTRSCVNPAHLRIGTHDENMAEAVYNRKTHCVHGHDKLGLVHCRTCAMLRARIKRGFGGK